MGKNLNKALILSDSHDAEILSTEDFRSELDKIPLTQDELAEFLDIEQEKSKQLEKIMREGIEKLEKEIDELSAVVILHKAMLHEQDKSNTN